MFTLFLIVVCCMLQIQENYEEYEQTIRTMLVQAAEVLKIRR